MVADPTDSPRELWLELDSACELEIEVELELELWLELIELELMTELDNVTLEDVLLPPSPPPPQAVRPHTTKGRLQILIRYRMAILRLRYYAEGR